MNVKLITAPTALAVDLSLLKIDLRIDDNTQDALLTAYINAAAEACEHRTKRKLMQQTWELALDAFPVGAIRLPFHACDSIESIKYIDSAGTEQTINSANYVLDNYGRVNWALPASSYYWPEAKEVANAVKVRFVCGVATAAELPASIKAWLNLAVRDIMACCPDGNSANVKDKRFYQSLLDQHISWEL
jgi:uncharacterized phiE125 gp8 family phage protein